MHFPRLRYIVFIMRPVSARRGTQEGLNMDFLTSNSMLLMEKSMGYLWTKQAAILDNIANAETPNYKAKVVTFEDSIRTKLEKAASRPQGVGKAVREILEDAELDVFEAQEQTRMDDNGVNITSEMTEMIRNAYQQQYVYRAISQQYSILRLAIKGQ